MWLQAGRKLAHGWVVLKKMTLAGVLNGILLVVTFYISRWLNKPFLYGRPWTLSVEPSGVCNLQCPECPVGAGVLNRQGGMLSVSLFQKLIKEGGRSLRYINLFFQGEPMMNPKIHQMVRLAADKNIYTTISTNGHQLTNDRCENLVNSGLTRLIVSLDGATSATYSQYRKGGLLKKVQDGITTMVMTRKETGSVTPFIVVQFLVFKHNEHEIPQIMEWCRKSGVDKLELKSVQINEYGHGEVEPPANERYSRYLKEGDGTLKLKGKMYNHCFRQWGGAVVSWDGRVAPCCYDKDLEYSMGSLKETDLQPIWTGHPLNKFRHKVLNHKQTIDICRNCPEGRHWLI